MQVENNSILNTDWGPALTHISAPLVVNVILYETYPSANEQCCTSTNTSVYTNMSCVSSTWIDKSMPENNDGMMHDRRSRFCCIIVSVDQSCHGCGTCLTCVSRQLLDSRDSFKLLGVSRLLPPANFEPDIIRAPRTWQEDCYVASPSVCPDVSGTRTACSE